MNINPTLQILFFTNGFLVLSLAMVTPIYALFAESIGASIATVGFLAATLFVGKIAGLLIMSIWGDIADHKARLYLWGFSLQVMAWIILITADMLWYLFIAQVLTGLSYALSVPAFRMLVATHLDKGRELYDYATWDLTLALTGLFGGGLGALVVSVYGFQTLFIILAVFTGFLTIVLWFYRHSIE